LFEDKKDSIKLTSLITSVVDQETQEKIDAVKTRLIRDYGYCDVCATDTLNYVASIFARGDAVKPWQAELSVTIRVTRTLSRTRSQGNEKYISHSELLGKG